MLLVTPRESELTLVHNGDEEGLGAMDIVFLHGPMAHSRSTWTHPGTGVFWPRDLLARESQIDKARIWTFDYDSSPSTFLEGDALGKSAESLIAALVSQFGHEFQHISNGTIVFVAHGLGGLVAQKATAMAKDTKYMQQKSIHLVLLGTPYFGPRSRYTTDIDEPTQQQLEQVKRFEEILGEEIHDPEAVYQLWAKTAAEVHKYSSMGPWNGWTKIASFWESEPTDEDGVILKKEHALFQGEETINLHLNNIGLGHKGVVDRAPMVFEIQAKHTNLGRFRDGQDPAYICLHKIISTYQYYCNTLPAIELEASSGLDWFG